MKLIRLLQTLLTGAAALGLLLLALVEIAAAYPVPWWLYIALGVAFTAGLIQRKSGHHRWVRPAVLLALLAVMAALYLIPWTSRKPFLRDLRRVKVGMSEAEVRKIMRGYMTGTGWPAIPGDAPAPDSIANGAQPSRDTASFDELEIPNALVFRHSDKAEFNSDWGVISLSNGLVVKVEFLPD